ncbi:MAG: HAD family hydrolase [Candidatus Hodarchaeales archaeon]
MIFENESVNGLIFDCDGLLVDSEPLSCYALNMLFEKYFNVDIGSDYSHVLGKTTKDSLDYYFREFNLSFDDINLLLVEKDQIYQELAKESLKAFPGVREFIKFTLKMGYKLIVASSGSTEKILFSLTKTKLIDHFSTIVSSSEVTYGKPAPDLFLKAAEKLDLNPNQCIVFEDSISGIVAAKKASMLAIGITNTFPSNKLRSAGADLVVGSFSELLQMIK